MTVVDVGLDLGGTKAAVIAATPEGERLVDTVVAAEGWSAEPIPYGTRWVLDLLARTLPAGLEARAVGIGAQGLDTAEIAEEFAAALAAHGVRSRCVNDAALLVPAAGLDRGIGLIAGTGAIGVSTDAEGRPLITGGWGWIIGDEAGSAGIVREATRSALLAHDDGAADDGLLAALLGAFGVADAERLARSVNDEATMDHWGPAAPAVFAAAAAGSARATRVVVGAAEHLARLVDQLVRRGAVGTDVVAAGSVIVNQPMLADELAQIVGERHPGFRVRLLTEPPVVGALAIARRLAS
jgi:N-acetylglucosamine kinase-like BadF-type ATPase